MRPVLPPLLALVLGAACAVLVACGSGGDSDALIPAARADALQRELDRLDRAVRTGDCESVGGAVSRLQDEVNGLSNQVDAALRERLNEGVANLADIAPEECLEAESDETETTTTETTPVETTPTETVPPETTETEPPPVETTETQPPPVETTDPEPPPVETIPPDDTGGATPEQPSDDTGDTGGASPTP